MKNSTDIQELESHCQYCKKDIKKENKICATCQIEIKKVEMNFTENFTDYMTEKTIQLLKYNKKWLQLNSIYKNKICLSYKLKDLHDNEINESNINNVAQEIIKNRFQYDSIRRMPGYSCFVYTCTKAKETVVWWM